MTPVRAIVAVLSAALIALALWQLKAAEQGITVTPLIIEGIPATAYQASGGAKTPAVVIAHGFAGSQQLMESFAVAFARNGYTAITFDFAGHGRNPAEMSGDVNLVEGATRRLLEDVTRVAAKARALGDGRIAVLGHSMASDIIVRFAESDPSVVATIAVSMFSPAVTATSPRNLLVIAGDWEGTLKREALRSVGLVSAPQPPQAGVTYGDFKAGTARRAAFSPHTEHVTVLFSEFTMRESLAWLDESFGMARQTAPEIDARGPWIVALLGAVVMLGWPLSALLPCIHPVSTGAGLSWRRIWPGVIIPAVATPLVLRGVPTHFLPMLVGDYLAVHFLVYGLITCAWLLWRGNWPRGEPVRRFVFGAFSLFTACRHWLWLRRARVAVGQLRDVLHARPASGPCWWRFCLLAPCPISWLTNG